MFTADRSVLAAWPVEAIVEAIADGIVIHDAAGAMIAANAAAHTLLGTSAAPWVGTDGVPLAPADHPAALALAADAAVAATIGIGHDGGTTRWLHVHSTPLSHPQHGRVVLSTLTEADALCQAQKRLADSERRYRAIFDHTYEFIGLLDTDGRLIEANAAALSFIGKTMDEVAGLPFADTPWWIHSPAARERLALGIRDAAAGRFVRFETTHPGQDGSVAVIDFSLKPVTDSDGRVIYIIPEGREITHRKQAEQALREAKMQAEAANHAKSAFLAAISHELRTPLNAVIGFSETILQQVFGPLGNLRYAEYVELIHTAGCHLRDVIEDILDVARIETGALSLRESDIDLDQCLGNAVDMIRPKARDAHIALHMDLPADLPLVRADPLRLRQIMLNLLSNAVKFTPPGGRVRLSVHCDDDGLTLAVADTGIGIRPEDQEHIWTPFFQADASLSRRFGGTGLGLPIVRHYVEAHGGAITVDSTPGIGSTFTLRLPAGRLLRPANDGAGDFSAAGKRS